MPTSMFVAILLIMAIVFHVIGTFSVRVARHYHNRTLEIAGGVVGTIGVLAFVSAAIVIILGG